MKVRRVVTGQDASGKSVFVSDEEVEPVTLALFPGAEAHRLWGGEHVPTLPADGSATPQQQYFPGPGGYRFGFFTLPPDGQAAPENIDFEAALKEAQEKMPGLIDHMEPDSPGMHTTDTVDFEIVISGEVVLELDDGAEVTLKPGDTVVQNGTRHAWRNRGSEPVVLGLFIIGAQRT